MPSSKFGKLWGVGVENHVGHLDIVYQSHVKAKCEAFMDGAKFAAEELDPHFQFSFELVNSDQPCMCGSKRSEIKLTSGEIACLRCGVFDGSRAIVG